MYDGFVDYARQERLMAVVDCLGKDVFWARERSGNSLHLKQSHRSGRWTSRWDELLTV